ncbi:MAG TPA: hypothetical protein VIZ28_14310 [Chitinophagaceae bacterium]
MKRNDFLKMGALAMGTPLFDSFLVKAAVADTSNNSWFKDDILSRLVAANDTQVAGLLQSVNPDSLKFSRRIGYDFSMLAASYCSPGSKYYHSSLIVPKLEIITQVLANYQSVDGTVNISNLESPPDTAFLIELLAAGAYILAKDNAKELSAVNDSIKVFLVKAGNALTTGGVHTPNHRWVICAALARLNSLYPDTKYVNRVEEWLGEGIFIDSDGHYPERSRLYSGVENNSLITMGRLLNKPSLFDPVKKNLESSWYYMEPDGDLSTTDSRRQDQYMSKTIVSYYLHYRYMALKDKNGLFAGIAKLIEQMKGFNEEILDRSLFHFLENPLLLQELPIDTAPPVNYEKFFATSQLLRIRRENRTATLFGGIDWPLIIASGRSNSPDFYSYRNGKAVLKYMRLSSNFFSMGYFYSEGIRKDGNKYVLHKKLEIPYYQPLPADKRNKEGDYKLSPSIDDRFWNKMDFNNRPVSNVKTLETTVTFLETNEGNEITFRVAGLTGVPVTIELCFAEGGKLSGVSEAGNDNSFLEKGMGQYEFGGDMIRFGPGSIAHRSIDRLEGERYSTHFGSLRTKGMHVYITGVTPFEHKLVFS